MAYQRQTDSNKASDSFRATLDLAMGSLYIIIPMVAMSMPYKEYGKNNVMTIGGIFAVYGLTRIVRGLLKMRSMFMRKR
jgi:hypothetical protein